MIDLEVRIEALGPFRVTSVYRFEDNPEGIAFETIMTLANRKLLLEEGEMLSLSDILLEVYVFDLYTPTSE